MSVPFVLPIGLDLQIGETFSLHHDGDVELWQAFGRPIGKVEARGDVTLHLEVATGEIRAGGKLAIEGRVEAHLLHGEEVILGSGDVKATAISAEKRIVIGAAKLAVDVIMAPEIVIDPRASGRVTVIESNTEVGPTKIKGGFTLAEYEESIGEPAAFLEERGLTALFARMRSSAPPAEPVPAVTSPIASAVSLPPPVSRTFTAPPPSQPIVPKPTAPVPPPPPVEEDVGDPMSLSVEDLEPMQLREEPVEDALYPKLSDAIQRIVTCYEGKELPPAVAQLRDLVQARDYDRLRENITEIWNGLLGYHQKKGIRPHHQVTHAFNVIHGLVQQG